MKEASQPEIILPEVEFEAARALLERAHDQGTSLLKCFFPQNSESSLVLLRAKRVGRKQI